MSTPTKRVAQLVWGAVLGIGAIILIAMLTGPAWMGLWEWFD